MNEQNISKTPDLPVKRKRGRPRKDETQPRPHPLPPVAPPPPPPPTIQPPPTTAALPPVDHSMVGQAVTCIIDGIFDNGYLLSTRLGPNNSILRGIVFQQGHVAPVTPENDVAPHLQMCTRSEFPIPPANPRTPVQLCNANDQSVCVKEQPGEAVTVQNYQNAPQPESLRLVEQDDVMQVFEVSKASEEAKDCGRRPENEDAGCDRTAESFPVIPEDMTGMESEQHGNQDISGIGMEHEQRVTVEEPQENQPSLGKDELHQESKEQTGEVNNIDSNQDPSQTVAVDLSLSNFSEI